MFKKVNRTAMIIYKQFPIIIRNEGMLSSKMDIRYKIGAF